MTDGPRPTGSGPASLFEQFGHTRGSFRALFSAHVVLFKAEISDILNQLKSMAALAGMALAVALVVGNMLYIGGFLFLGEWLFGSIGWGLAHGVLFGLGLMVALGLGIVGARRSGTLVSFLIASVIAIALALGLGSNVFSNAAANLAAQLPAPLNSNGIVAALGGALVVAILFALIFARIAGVRGAIGGFVLGAILGLLFGWVAAGAPWTWPPAVGFAITVGLLLWPVLNFAISWPSVNVEERFSSLYPRQSIEAVNETRDWMKEQWQTRRPKPGNR